MRSGQFYQLNCLFSVGLMCLVSFIVALIFTMGSGNYWLAIFNNYVGSLPLLVIAFFEITSVIYIYGANRCLLTC